MEEQRIFGYRWSDIQRAQQGGSLVDTDLPRKPQEWLASDQNLLEQYRSRVELAEAGYHGVVDRMNRLGIADLEPAAVSQAWRRREFDKVLREKCCITVADAGLSDAEVDLKVEGCNSTQEIVQSVLDYADDYDLEIVGRGWTP